MTNNPNFSFNRTFTRNGIYIFSFNNTDTSNTNLRERQIPAKVTWIYANPTTVPMHWTRTAAAGQMKIIPYINTEEETRINRGDGSAIERIFVGSTDNLAHTYATAGSYTVTILNPQPLTELYLGTSDFMSMVMG
ncbi:MAG: hypothetical protein LBI53_00215 [Candidatus Peribacteria bacterium]|nr:hypothetical protein [Candidatus Peribacteria bacterium]